MSSCIKVVYLTVLMGLCSSAVGAAQAPVPDPDALYSRREEPGRAREAVDIWAARLATNPKDFEAAWKRARALYWLGGGGPEASRRRDLEAGIAAWQAAIAIDPSRPDGHFWMAANMGALAESFGLRQGIRYRGTIKEALERVLAIDPAYQQGSADRALGRWYFKVPGMFGGSSEKAEFHLNRSLTYHATSTASLFFLAEVYLDSDRIGEAKTMLQRVIDAPLDVNWAPEDRQFKEQARLALKRIAGR